MTSKQANKMKAGRRQDCSVINFNYKVRCMQVQIHKMGDLFFLKHFLISNSSVQLRNVILMITGREVRNKGYKDKIMIWERDQRNEEKILHVNL